MYAPLMKPDASPWKKIGDELKQKPEAFRKPALRTPAPASDARFGDPTLPPSAGKKRSYWIWFASIICLEVSMIRRATLTLSPFSYDAVWNKWLLHTQALNIAAHLLMDTLALRALNALGEHSGLSFPARLGGAPVLNVSEENVVLCRHFFKLIQRNPAVNGMLLGAKPDGFHGYELKQVYMMILSPTFFGVLFAVKSTEGLAKMSIMNFVFVIAHVLLMPFAYKYTDGLRDVYFEKLGPEEVWRVNFAKAGVVVALAPFVFAIVVRVMRWGEFENREAAGGERVGDGMAHIEDNEKASEQLVGDAVQKNVSQNKVTGLRLDGGTDVSVSSLCFTNGAPQYVVVRETLEGVLPRVFFDGRLLRTSSEPTVDPSSGETHTLLKVYPPEWLDLGGGLRPVGRAWVVTGRKNPYQSQSIMRSLTRAGQEQQKQIFGNDSIAQVGEAVPLLFLDDPEVTREVNSVVNLIREKMDGIKANRLVMRLGNCITHATFNPRDMEAMREVVATMGMKRCQAMLKSIAAAETQAAVEVSQAPREQETRHLHRRRIDYMSPSSTEDEDVVEGPVMERLPCVREEQRRGPTTRTNRTRRGGTSG